MMMTTSLMVGRSKPGWGLCPALSFKDLHDPSWGGGRGESGPASAWADDPLLPPASEGGRQPPALRRRRPPTIRGRQTAAAWPGCSIPSSVRAAVAGRTGGSHNTSYAARAVLVFWDGHVLVLVARTGVRTCRCGLGRPPLAGAVLVGRWPLSSVLRWWQPENVSLPTTPSVPPALRASGSLALMAGSRPPRGDVPSSGSVRPGAIAAVVLPSETEVVATLLVQRSPASHPEFVVPQALRCGGCSYPRECNRSSVCNGTLSVGVCSLWLSGPEHLGILA
jgi:hypothetical protein